MIKEFLLPKREVSLDAGQEKGRKFRLMMVDQPELSLGPSTSTLADSANSSSSESDANTCRKRKHAWEEEPITQTSIELNLNDPLPLDWEQCLDLQSGRMYYLNKKSLKKSWSRPKEQNLDLELNISTEPSSEGRRTASKALEEKNSSSPTGNMVAVACSNCHLLVMLCRSSPSCPNCKYMHHLPKPKILPSRIEAVKPLETLNLLI